MTEEEIITVVDHAMRGGRLEKKNYKTCYWIDWSYDRDGFNFNESDLRIHPEEQDVISHYNRGGVVECKSKKASWDWYEIQKGTKDERDPKYWNYKEDRIIINSKKDNTSNEVKRAVKVLSELETNKESEIKVPTLLRFPDKPTYNEQAIRDSLSYILGCLNKIVKKIN